MTFLGLPFTFWSAVCAAAALRYFFVYPKPADATVLMNWVLRYAHTLAWALLCAASLTAALSGNLAAAQGIAFAALAVYLASLPTLALVRRR